MLVKKFVSRFPKYAVVLAIVGVSTGAFLIWQMGRGDSDSGDSGNGAGNSGPPAALPANYPDIELDPASMFVAGGSLYQLQGEQVELVRENWIPLSGEGRVDYLHSQNLVVVSDQSGFSCYDPSGRPRGKLAAPGKSSFDGYLTSGLEEGVFWSGGDIWRSAIDWSGPTLNSPRQVTAVGYLQGSGFARRVRAGTAEALVYHDMRQSTLRVDLRDGSVKPLSLPTNIVPSPGQSLLVGDIFGKTIRLVVHDVESGETAEYPMELRLQRNGLLWLSDTSFVINAKTKLLHYDHAAKSLDVVYSGKGKLVLGTQLSPDKKRFLFVEDGVGFKVMEVAGMKSRLIDLYASFTGMDWVGANELLLVRNSPDTDWRGSWLVSTDARKLNVRVMDQPAYETYNEQRPMPRLVLAGGKTIIRGTRADYLLDTEKGEAELIKLNPGALLGIESR